MNAVFKNESHLKDEQFYLFRFAEVAVIAFDGQAGTVGTVCRLRCRKRLHSYHPTGLATKPEDANKAASKSAATEDAANYHV